MISQILFYKLKKMTWKIYVLKLQKDKYYVGKALDVWARISQHFHGQGGEVTKQYPPINIVSVYQSTSRFDEDNETKRMMEIYGIQNVRGGSYNRIDLSEAEEYVLNRELRTLEDRCYKCGKKGHFVRDCKQEKKEESITTNKPLEKQKKIEKAKWEWKKSKKDDDDVIPF